MNLLTFSVIKFSIMNMLSESSDLINIFSIYRQANLFIATVNSVVEEVTQKTQFVITKT